MIDIPLGKALVPEESDSLSYMQHIKGRNCKACVFYRVERCWDVIPCFSKNRKDGKNVIYKLVDYPAKEKQ